MKCENCGTENPNDQKFCENCGNVLAPEQPEELIATPQPIQEDAVIECSICKQQNPQGTVFCNGCGASLQDGLSTETPEEPINPQVSEPELSIAPKSKFLVLPDGTELSADEKKTFGRIDFARQASEPMWISRQHFTIFDENGLTYIQDDRSSNGTKLNGQEIKLHGRQQLKDGDEITVGDSVKLVFKTK